MVRSYWKPIELTARSVVRVSAKCLPAVFHDPPVLQLQVAVGEIENSVVVGDHDRCCSSKLAQTLEQLYRLHTRFFVQCGGRLIGENDGWIPDQRASDGDSQFLAARQLRWPKLD